MSVAVKRFVILSSARSGTSLLKETLAVHPDILTHGEIFHNKSEWHIHPQYLDAHDISYRYDDPVRFVKNILATPLDHRIVGFKMWRQQSEAACKYVLGSSDIVKVILERPNRLAALSSNLLAEKTNIWNIRVTEGHIAPQRSQTVPFNPYLFARYREEQDRLFESYRKEARGPVINLTYPQVARLEIDELVDALEISNYPFKHQMRKLYESNIIDRFNVDDRQAILTELERLGCAEWLQERV